MSEKEKFLDPKEYRSLDLIPGIAKTNNSASTNTLINLLIDSSNRDVREDVLLLLKKEESAVELLVEAIENPRYLEYKNKLIAACWESGTDCSKYLPVFIAAAINESYVVALEAVTVIENMEGPFDEEELAQAKKDIAFVLKAKESEKHPLLNILREILVRF